MEDKAIPPVFHVLELSTGPIMEAWTVLDEKKEGTWKFGDDQNSYKTSDQINTFDRSFKFTKQGPVVRRPIIANPGLNFNPGLFFFSSKAFSWTIFSILFRVANHQIVDKKN